MLNDVLTGLTTALAKNETFREAFHAARSFDEAAAIAHRHGCAVTAADLKTLAQESSTLAEGELSEAELETIGGGEAALFSMLSSLLKSCDQIASGVVNNLRA